MSRARIAEIARAFLAEDEAEGNALYTLQSWLPSTASANHQWGDSAHYHTARQSRADIIGEASRVMAQFAGYGHSAEEIGEWFWMASEGSLPDPDVFLPFVREWFAKHGHTLKVKGEEA